MAAIGLAALAVITFRITFGDIPMDAHLRTRNLSYVLDVAPWLHSGTADAALLAFKVLLPVACWCIAWMRVAESQVSDGV